jgi:hypothetical protein
MNTTATCWTAAAIRLMALWLVVDLLIGLPGFFANWHQQGEFGEQAELIAASLRANLSAQIATSVVAALLWFRNASIARFVWKEPESSEIQCPVTAIDLERAVLVGVGTYLVVYGIPNLVELAAGYYSLPAGFQLEQHYSGRMNARAVGVAIQIAAGLGLILGSTGISGLIEKVRSSRRDSEADDVAEE